MENLKLKNTIEDLEKSYVISAEKKLVLVAAFGMLENLNQEIFNERRNGALPVHLEKQQEQIIREISNFLLTCPPCRIIQNKSEII